jgi:hypothetical protein
MIDFAFIFYFLIVSKAAVIRWNTIKVAAITLKAFLSSILLAKKNKNAILISAAPKKNTFLKIVFH